MVIQRRRHDDATRTATSAAMRNPRRARRRHGVGVLAATFDVLGKCTYTFWVSGSDERGFV
jgi:hypothetical protein